MIGGILNEKEKITSLVLAITVAIVSTMFPSVAIGSSDDYYGKLYEIGYTKEMVDTMETECRNLLITTLQHSPEKVQVFKTSMEINEVEELEDFLSMTDQELFDIGFSKEDIEFQRSRAYKALNDTMERGTIDSNVLDFIVSAVDVSNTTSSVKYTIIISFSWAKPFLMDAFSDKIAVCWGGDLFESDISKGDVGYYKFTKPNTWNSYFYSTEMNAEDEVPNSSILKTFRQNYNGVSQAKRGTFHFTLSRNNKVGEKTNLIARYGHQIIAIDGIGITWGFPSITFGTAYDQTPIDKGKITLSY